MAFVTCGLEGRGCLEGRLRRRLLSCPEVWVGGHRLFPRGKAEFGNPDDGHGEASQSNLCIPQLWLEGADGLTSCLGSWSMSADERLSSQDPYGFCRISSLASLIPTSLQSFREKAGVCLILSLGWCFFPIPRYVHSQTLFSP